MWAHSGRELFYRNRANELVAVQVTADSTFTAGQQDVLFSMTNYLFGEGRPAYDVTRMREHEEFEVSTDRAGRCKG